MNELARSLGLLLIWRDHQRETKKGEIPGAGIYLYLKVRNSFQLPVFLGCQTSTMTSLSSSPSKAAKPTTTSATTKQRNPSREGQFAQSFAVILIVCTVTSLWASVRYGLPDHHHPHTAIAKAMREFKQQQQPYDGAEHSQRRHVARQQHHKKAQHHQQQGSENVLHPTTQLKGLSCQAHGGPLDRAATEEMVYWSDIPSDAQFVSPFHPSKRNPHQSSSSRRLFMTFEPDGGGWNNIRMAMETVIGLAVSMGRTLILPPEQRMYLLGKQDGKQRHQFSFMDFFPLQAVAQEHVGLDIMTMEEFLLQEAITGHLVNRTTGEVAFPPLNRTKWDNLHNPKELKWLKEYLRDVTHNAIWRPTQCLAVFPASENPHDVDALQDMHQQLLASHSSKRHKSPELGHPVPVDAPTIDRLRDTFAHRPDLCVYDPDMQQALVVHFMCFHQVRMRLLVHFYAFLFFEDWHFDTWMKRFIRDHVRYNDEIQCAAARIVQAVRERSKQRKVPGIKPGEYDSFHIRRGDFQFKETRIPAEEIYKNSQKELTPHATIYVATDERNKTFFDPLRKHYDLVFLDDFAHLLEGINTNYYGQIDQLVASKGRIFFGCWFSTFTGYINRIRGYHSVKNKLPGYQNGTLPTTYYYATLRQKFTMHEYSPLRGGFFNREFPTSWRDIDRGIGWLSSSSEGDLVPTTEN